MVNPDPPGAVQVRPSRPLPAVCSWAISTAPCGVLSVARAARSVLVDKVDATVRTRHGLSGGRSAVTDSAAIGERLAAVNGPVIEGTADRTGVVGTVTRRTLVEAVRHETGATQHGHL